MLVGCAANRDRGFRLVERGALGKRDQRTQRVGCHAQRLRLRVRLATNEHDAAALSAVFDAEHHFAAESTLADAGRTRDADDDRSVIVGASFEGIERRDELGITTDEGHRALLRGGELRDFSERRERGAVGKARYVDLESPARYLGGGRVGGELAVSGIARELGSTIDDVAARASQVDAGPPGRDTHARATLGEIDTNFEGTRRFVAMGSACAEVSDDRVCAERKRVCILRLELFDDALTLFARRDMKSDQRRHEARSESFARVFFA